MTPTRAGEGKTTTLVGLTQGLGVIGKNPVACLREPRSGPYSGSRAARRAAGTQVVPMEDLNLHFTGDIHAVGAANNLLSAMIDASILHGNPQEIDALRIGWRRAVDMNDRALRDIASGSVAARTATRARPASTSPPPPRSWGSSPSRATSPTCAAARPDHRRVQLYAVSR